MLVALATSPVWAAEWLEVGNKDGGKILLLQDKCSDKKDEIGRLAITATAGGRSLTGCWYYSADMIHVVWADKTLYSYTKEIFTYRNDEK